MRSFSAWSRPCRNSFLASSEAVVMGILPPPAGVGAAVAAAGAGASFFAQPAAAASAAAARIPNRPKNRFVCIVCSFAIKECLRGRPCDVAARSETQGVPEGWGLGASRTLDSPGWQSSPGSLASLGMTAGGRLLPTCGCNHRHGRHQRRDPEIRRFMVCNVAPVTTHHPTGTIIATQRHRIRARSSTPSVATAVGSGATPKSSTRSTLARAAVPTSGLEQQREKENRRRPRAPRGRRPLEPQPARGAPRSRSAAARFDPRRPRRRDRGRVDRRVAGGVKRDPDPEPARRENAGDQAPGRRRAPPRRAAAIARPRAHAPGSAPARSRRCRARRAGE